MHRDADCLSRHPVDPPDPTGNDDDPCVFAVSDLLNIADHQRRDPSLRKIVERLTTEPTDPSMRAFMLRDGILFRRNFHADGRDELLAVPRHLRSDVLRELHDAPTAGHLGVARTYDRVRRRF